MLSAVRITEVPSEPRADRIQTGRCFTFFFLRKQSNMKDFF